MTAWLHRHRFIILVFFVCWASFGLRLLSLYQTSFANGWDGYFYVNQTHSILEEGKMDVPDRSLIYLLLTAASYVTGDYVVSLKLIMALLAAAFSVSCTLLAKKWTEDFRVATFVAAFTLFSPHLTYFAAQYPKNLLGVNLFLLTVYFIDSKYKALPFVLLFINFFGHRTTTVLATLYVISYHASRQSRRSVYALAVFALCVFIVAGIFLPGLLNFADIERLQGLFTAVPQFGPLSFAQSFGSDLLSYSWIMEIVISGIIVLIAIIFFVIQISRNAVDRRQGLFLVIVLLTLFPFFEWSIDGIAFRLTLIGILLSPLLFLPLVSQYHAPRLTIVAMVGLLAVAPFSLYSYSPKKHDPPYHRYAKLSSRIRNELDKSNCELIIAHKSLAEAIVFFTGLDAMSWVPEYKIPREKLWRVAADVPDVQLDRFLDDEQRIYAYRLSFDYVLIRDDAWQFFFEASRADQEIHERLTSWRNPMQQRPAYLRRPLTDNH
jgi:hypothetical protein